MSESFDYSYDSTLGYDSWFLLSFTRGSVQIKDNNAYGGQVAIDPRYFGTEFDTLAQAATARYTRTVSGTQPLSPFVTGESAPGVSVPQGASLDQWATWVKANFRSNWHPAGTVSGADESTSCVLTLFYRLP
jgi:choline dehydrogenase-like flavoprotein